MPAQLADLDLVGADSRHLMGHKREAYRHIQKHKAALWSGIKAADWNGARLQLLCAVPGLGIVKSGFILQLMGYDVACLDSRNVEREGRDPRAFRTPYTRKKIARYLLDTQGRSREYWDAWCEDVAQAYDLTPFAVSALHMAIVPSENVPF